MNIGPSRFFFGTLHAVLEIETGKAPLAETDNFVFPYKKCVLHQHNRIMCQKTQDLALCV